MRRLLSFALVVFAVGQTAKAEDAFALKEGDRVVFYGDSITDQRLYTTFTETFVVTRFPKMNVRFVHSGWGGDRVTGGGGGPIDVRLKRDVLAYRPTVMTVMLGMNDASYQPFKQDIFDTYAKGYENIVATMKKEIPGIRMTLIQPSPFDDVTRPPNFEGGYNAVLVRYGEFVKELAKKNGLDVADLNTYVVEATKKAFASDPENAKNLNPDRVHPAPSGQLLMAAALLKAWRAPGLVSSVKVTINDKSEVAAVGVDSAVSDIKLDGGKLTWNQLDEALPFPVNLNDKNTALAIQSSDFIETLNEQPLTVQGLAVGNYHLKIDNMDIGDFSTADLAKGINLAVKDTPMTQQASRVHGLTLRHNDLHFTRWRMIEVPFESEAAEQVKKASVELDAIEDEVVKKQRAEAQPKPHAFELTKKS